MDVVSRVVCIVVDRSPDVHHRAGDQVDQKLHDPDCNSLEIIASIVLAVDFKRYLDAEDEEEVKNKEKCDGQSFVMNLKDVFCGDKENDEDKYPCNDLRDVTEEERPHVAEVLKEGHSVLEVASHGQTQALEEHTEEKLAQYFLKEAGFNSTRGDEMCSTIESLLGRYRHSPIIDLVIKGDEEVEDDDHLQIKSSGQDGFHCFGSQITCTVASIPYSMDLTMIQMLSNSIRFFRRLDLFLEASYLILLMMWRKGQRSRIPKGKIQSSNIRLKKPLFLFRCIQGYFSVRFLLSKKKVMPRMYTMKEMSMVTKVRTYAT